MKADKIIAKYMGLKVVNEWVWLNEEYSMSVDNLRYSKSWDVLMKVIEKIESDPLNDVCIFKEATQIRRCNGQESIFDLEILKYNANSKIDHAYEAVVAFIERENEYLTDTELKYEIIE